LQATFLIRLLPAWSRNSGKRFTKAPKLHLNDAGLACQPQGTDLSIPPASSVDATSSSLHRSKSNNDSRYRDPNRDRDRNRRESKEFDPDSDSDFDFDCTDVP
jgi:predicted AAA+ superfamily ATPase